MNKGIEIIKHYETIHDGDLKQIGLQPKMCPAGIWTVGYGRALTHPKEKRFLKGPADKALAYSLYPGLTVAEACAMLEEDTKDFSNYILSLVKVTTTEYQLGAMLSLCYNIGKQQFKNSTLLIYHNKKDFSLASTRFAPFNKSRVNGVLTVLTGLVYRRQSETLLYKSDQLEYYN